MDCIRHCASFVYMIVAYCVWHTIAMSQHPKLYVQKPILIAELTLTLHNLESILHFNRPLTIVVSVALPNKPF